MNEPKDTGPPKYHMEAPRYEDPLKMIEDPKARKQQRIHDAFLIGTVQAGAMNVDYFNRKKK